MPQMVALVLGWVAAVENLPRMLHRLHMARYQPRNNKHKKLICFKHTFQA